MFVVIRVMYEAICCTTNAILVNGYMSFFFRLMASVVRAACNHCHAAFVHCNAFRLEKKSFDSSSIRAESIVRAPGKDSRSVRSEKHFQIK